MSIDEEKRRLERRATAGDDPSDAKTEENMSQDEDIRALEREAAAGDAVASEKYLAAQRRMLSATDADYLERYLRLCDEVVGSDGYRIVGYSRQLRDPASTYGQKLAEAKIPPVFPRSRPVENVLADLKALNDEFETKVSSPRILRRTIATLDSFRDGVEVATWSHSTLGCMPSEDYGNDPNVAGFVGEGDTRDMAFFKVDWAELQERAAAIDRDRERRRLLEDAAPECVSCKKKVLPEASRHYVPYCGLECWAAAFEKGETEA